VGVGVLGLATRSPVTGLAVSVSHLADIRHVLPHRRPRGPGQSWLPLTASGAVGEVG